MAQEPHRGTAAGWLAAASVIVAVVALVVAFRDSETNAQALLAAKAASTAAAEANELAASANEIAVQAGTAATQANELAEQANGLADESNTLQQSVADAQRKAFASEVHFLSPDAAISTVATGPGSGAIQDVVVVLLTWDVAFKDLDMEAGESLGELLLPDPDAAFIYELPALAPCQQVDVEWPESGPEHRLFILTFRDVNSTTWALSTYDLEDGGAPADLQEARDSGLAAFRDAAPIAPRSGGGC